VLGNADGRRDEGIDEQEVSPLKEREAVFGNIAIGI
jgi:hypothetical protein